ASCSRPRRAKAAAVAVDLDRSPQPMKRLVVTAEAKFADANEHQPIEDTHVARAEPERLTHPSFQAPRFAALADRSSPRPLRASSRPALAISRTARRRIHPDVVALVRAMARQMPDMGIAAALNRAGKTTAKR